MRRFWKRRPPSERLTDWLITCGPANPKWQVRLASCTQAHADSVRAQLAKDSSCPDDLKLREAR